MTTNAQHTPGEWIVNGLTAKGWRIDSLAEGRIGLDFLLHPIALVDLEANARFIVQACNSHAALLEALEDLLQPGAWLHDEECCSVKEGMEACDCGYLSRIEQGRAAIAQAKGER